MLLKSNLTNETHRKRDDIIQDIKLTCRNMTNNIVSIKLKMYSRKISKQFSSVQN